MRFLAAIESLPDVRINPTSSYAASIGTMKQRDDVAVTLDQDRLDVGLDRRELRIRAAISSHVSSGRSDSVAPAGLG